MRLSKWCSLLGVTVIVLAGGSQVATLPAPVRIDGGLVSGVAGGTANMRVFKGIPFAAPPVGPLRWRPPQPVGSWAGVRPADQFGARCMQRHPGPVLAYVLEGPMRFAINNEPVPAIAAGGTFFEPTGALHTGGGSASVDARARALVFMVVPKGSAVVTPA